MSDWAFKGGCSVREGAANIGQYGYSHWSHRPVTPDIHELHLVPQSIADGWQGFCSCGEWVAFASYYDHRTKESLLACIKDAHGNHAAMIERRDDRSGK